MPIIIVKKSILTIFICALLLSLSSCLADKMIYAKYGRFSVEQNEQVSLPVSGSDVADFDKCCYTESDQIFLNRVVRNLTKGYEIYISVSEVLLPSDYAKVLKADPNFQVLESRSDLIRKSKVDGYFLKKGEHYIARFVYVETKSGLLVIYDFTSGNQETAATCYKNMITYLDEKIRL